MIQKLISFLRKAKPEPKKNYCKSVDRLLSLTYEQLKTL
jgi:hypothetical protein